MKTFSEVSNYFFKLTSELLLLFFKGLIGRNFSDEIVQARLLSKLSLLLLLLSLLLLVIVSVLVVVVVIVVVVVVVVS